MLRSATLLALFTALSLAAAPARAQWSNGTIPPARGFLASTSVGDKLFFAGGADPATPAVFDEVNVYDAATDTWTTLHLSQARERLSAAGVDDLALFAGGGQSASSPSAVVDVLDTQTMTWKPVSALSQARGHMAVTTVGSKAIFAGGSDGTQHFDTVDIYDASTGTWVPNPGKLSLARHSLAATTVGNLAFFAGGEDPTGQAFDRVDVYDASSGTWSVANPLSQKRTRLAATTAGTRAFFAGGGEPFVAVYDVVDVFDASLGLPPTDPNAWSTDSLSQPRFWLQAVALGNTAIFAGGADVVGASPVVDMLNVGTGQWDSSSVLSESRFYLGAATVAGKAMFGGGINQPGSLTATDTLDVYEPVGINYCEATTNSTGCAATISASGSSSLAANNLTLSSNCMPDGVFIFFHATTQLQVPFGNGFLCANGNLFRILPAAAASGGLAQTTVDLPSVNITAPGVRNFQCWFRDPTVGAGFNTSDGLAITFVP